MNWFFIEHKIVIRLFVKNIQNINHIIRASDKGDCSSLCFFELLKHYGGLLDQDLLKTNDKYFVEDAPFVKLGIEGDLFYLFCEN